MEVIYCCSGWHGTGDSLSEILYSIEARSLFIMFVNFDNNFRGPFGGRNCLTSAGKYSTETMSVVLKLFDTVKARTYT